jgi:hypothetical protein
MAVVWIRSVRYGIGELPRADLLPEHQKTLMEECLVELDETFQDMGLVRKAVSQLGEPMANRMLREFCEADRLTNGNLSRPTPQHGPELDHRQLHVR